MMLSLRQKADHSTPGFKHRAEKGLIEGRLRTLFPVRFKTAWRKAWIGAFPITLLCGLASVPIFDGHAMLGAALISLPGLYLLFLAWEHGVFLRMTTEYFQVGRRRYDLAHISTFNIEKSRVRRFDFILTFDYGRKTIKIRVRNSHRHALDIALLLNTARKTLLEQALHPQTQDAPRMGERSAAF